MMDMSEGCDVVYRWALPPDRPTVLGWEMSGRTVMLAPLALRVEHCPGSDPLGVLHVFIDGMRVRGDGILGTAKGLEFSDEPEGWNGVQHTDELPEWAAPYVETVRAWEAPPGTRGPRAPATRSSSSVTPQSPYRRVLIRASVDSHCCAPTRTNRSQTSSKGTPTRRRVEPSTSTNASPSPAHNQPRAPERDPSRSGPISSSQASPP